MTENTRPKECHKCPRNGKGDPYCWQVCIGPAEKSDKGRTFVRTGGLQAESEFIEQHIDEEYGCMTGSRRTTEDDFINAVESDEIDPDSLSEEELLSSPEPSTHGVTESLSDDIERALVKILANLFGNDSMSDVKLCIFRHIFKGENLDTIAKTLPVPISKQAVFKHLRSMVRINPVIGKVILQMKKAGHGGAKRRQSQLSLFDFMGVDVCGA